MYRVYMAGVLIVAISLFVASAKSREQPAAPNQKNQYDNGQRNQKDVGEQGQNDDGQKNQYDNGQRNQKDDGEQGQQTPTAESESAS